MSDECRRLVNELGSDGGMRLLKNIADLRGSSQIGPREVATLRKRWPAELVTLALRISEANERKSRKFPADEDLLFTPELLEQASAHPVALHRARALSGLGPVLDLGCGAGGDLSRVAGQGIEVVGIEADPLAAELARANLAALGLPGEILTGTFPDVELPFFRTLFADPARRDAQRIPGGSGKGGRRAKPVDFSPAPAQICQMLHTCKSWVIKWGPALDLSHEAMSGPGGLLEGFPPEAYEVELVSWNGELREAVFRGGDAASGRGRVATVLRGKIEDFETHVFSSNEAAPALNPAPARAWLHEPDPALIRSQLIESYAASRGMTLLAPQIAYLSGDSPISDPFVRSWPILEVFPFSVTRAQEALDRHQAGNLILKKRGFPTDPEDLRSRFRLSGDRHLTLFIYRGVEKRQACLCGKQFVSSEFV